MKKTTSKRMMKSKIVRRSKKTTSHEEDRVVGMRDFEKSKIPNKLISGCEFAGPSDVKVAYDWREQEVFVLLDVWGDRFFAIGSKEFEKRKLERSSEKVTEVLRSEKSETQCRRMIDNMKMLFRKDKIKIKKSRLVLLLNQN